MPKILINASEASSQPFSEGCLDAREIGFLGAGRCTPMIQFCSPEGMQQEVCGRCQPAAQAEQTAQISPFVGGAIVRQGRCWIGGRAIGRRVVSIGNERPIECGVRGWRLKTCQVEAARRKYCEQTLS